MALLTRPIEPCEQLNADLAKLFTTIIGLYREGNAPPYLAEWHRFFQQWADDPQAPLLIRRSTPKWIDEKEGKILIFCDNSPAHWAFAQAFERQPPAYDAGIALQMLADEIPIFTSLSKVERLELEKSHPFYKGIKTLWKGSTCNMADKNWRVDHIQKVGVNKQKENFDILDRSSLKGFFLRLMSPANIILTPKSLAGIGDIPAYLDLQAKEPNRIAFAKDFGI